jgi:para-nitrobenzyl esterase
MRFRPAVLNEEKFGKDAYDASAYRNTCHQTYGYGDIDPSEHPEPEAPPPAEDCLFLNVFRPDAKKRSNALLPVLFWVHGGGFCVGAGSERWNDGGVLAANNNAVVVTINYRCVLL